MTTSTRTGTARSADEVTGAVRVHIDRVHDAVRRLGCAPSAAVEVVESSGVELVEAVARRPAQVDDLVGWWIARARELGCRVVDGSEAAPVGGGVLARDERQRGLVEALERLAEPERVAVLLRDAYALGVPSVAAALHATPEVAGERIARGRLHLLPLMEDLAVPAVPTHADLPALARLSESGPVAASDATVRRPVQSCRDCAAVVAAQERASSLVAGLAVVAMPAAERTAVLDRISTRAAAVLPAVVTREPPPAPRERRPPVVSFAMVLLVIVAALLVGIVVGVLTAPN